MRTLLIITLAVWAVTGQHVTDSPDDHDLPDLRTVTIVEPPFLMLKDNHSSLVGNEKYEGFIVDLLAEVAERAGFTYRLYLVEDGRYGVHTHNHVWTGMVGDILNGDADMAAAPLTTTLSRVFVIDFSTTFMHVPLTLLVKKGVKIESLEELVELGEQDTMQYGARDGGMIAEALQSIPERPYSLMWAQMASFEPSAFVESIEAGVQRVVEGNFSLILDAPTAEYISHNTACETETQLVFFLGHNNASYAFGLSRESIDDDLKDAINVAIDELSKDGMMETFREKWWKHNCPAGAMTTRMGLLSFLVPLLTFVVLRTSS